MSKQEQHMKEMEENLLHVYNRFPYVFSHGDGMYIYDEDDNKYLDFGSGIGVMAFGYKDKEFCDAIKDQVDKIIHTSNLFYNSALNPAADILSRISKMDKVFFTNSGAEAVEGALKAAKKHAYLNKRGQNIIAFESSFHGRTIGAVSVTGTKHYREPFYPLMDGVKFAQFNDLDSVKALVGDDVCAIILEPLQGEGGIIPADEDFLRGIKELCVKNDIVLIFDEVQCGLGRTGEYYLWHKYDIRPDILCTAKALGAGIPVGAFLMTKEMAESSLTPGDHGTTYGGNPLACAAVFSSLSIMEKRDIPGHVKKLAPYFTEKLELLVKEKENVLERRGEGFMQGLVLKNPVLDVVKENLRKGLITLSAGGNVLRLLPPLIADKEDFDKCFEILKEVL